MTPADFAAMNGGNNWGNDWVLIILFALIFGGNGFFGGNNAYRQATAEDVANGFNFSALERQNNEITEAVRQGVYDTTASVKDASYNNLSELRDIQMEVDTGFANMQKCCCEIKQDLLENRYLSAQNTASINATTTAQTQKILDAMAQNKIDELRNRVNTLEMQNAMCGVVKYPNQVTYNAGNPFNYNTCGCNM